MKTTHIEFIDGSYIEVEFQTYEVVPELKAIEFKNDKGFTEAYLMLSSVRYWRIKN